LTIANARFVIIEKGFISEAEKALKVAVKHL
jgi:hypothetical protein